MTSKVCNSFLSALAEMSIDGKIQLAQRGERGMRK